MIARRKPSLNCLLYHVALLVLLILLVEPCSGSSSSLTPDDESYVDQVLNQVAEQEQQQRSLFFGRDQSAGAGASCTSTEDCQEGLECNTMTPSTSTENSSTTGMRCMARKDCLQRELEAMGHQFNPLAYKDMIMEQAQITDQDLWTARKQFKDDKEFVQSPPVVAFMQAVQQHQHELVQFAEIVARCEQGEEKEETVEDTVEEPVGRAGSFVGSLFSSALDAFGAAPEKVATPENHDTSPTVAPGPTSSPSSSPTNSIMFRSYIGFHMEGGFLIDGSYSVYGYGDDAIETQRLYGRRCLGFELGGGGEISLAILVTQNRGVNDLVSGSLLVDVDIALGAAMGIGGGIFVSGDSAVLRPLHYEVTIGTGLGIGLGGFSICRTLRVQ